MDVDMFGGKVYIIQKLHTNDEWLCAEYDGLPGAVSSEKQLKG
jgi:hypothetical protein